MGQRKRKVIAQVIKQIRDDEGTPINGEPISIEGIIHHWGVNSIPVENGVLVNTVIYIECLETGQIYKTMPEFVTICKR
jgi:hypothetical protein